MRLPILHLLAFALLSAAMGTAAAASSDVTGSCRVTCDQKLASCERTLAGKGHCPRKYQACQQECVGPAKKELRSKPKQKRDLCTQRCDLNYSTCQDANGTNAEQCRAGQRSCAERCK